MTLDTTSTFNIRGNSTSNSFTLDIATVNVIGTGTLRVVNHTANNNIIGGLVSFNTVNLDNGRFFVGGERGLTGGFAAASTNLAGGLFVGDYRGANGGIHLGAVTFTTDSGSSVNLLGAADTGGDLQVTSLNGGDAGTFVQLSSVASNVTAGNGAVVLNNPAGVATFDGVIRDNHASFRLALVMNGSGSQTFTRANTYTGGTVINSGTLIVEGVGTLGGGDIALAGGNWDISGISGGSYALTATQVLSAGGGTIIAGDKTVAVAGTLALDGGAGGLTFQGGMLDLSAAAGLVFELGAGAGAVVLGGGADLDIGILNFSDFTFQPLVDFGAGQYTLLSGWSTLFGSLGDDTGTINGYDATLILQGDSLVLTVIPEANAVYIAFVALALIFFIRRSRRGGA